MVICKYFQQGYCRFGPNCRFEHVYGSKYNYQAPAQNVPNSKSNVSSSTDEQLINLIQADVQAVLQGGQWILSGYAPYKEKPSFPGILDVSPEEARLLIYDAKASNNVDQAVAYVNKLFAENRRKYEQLLQPPTQAILKTCRSINNGETPPSPFSNNLETNTFSSTNNASSLFRSAVQKTQKPSAFDNSNARTLFSQAVNALGPNTSQTQNSVFGSNNNPSQSIFGQQAAQQNAAKSVFAQANQTIFGGNQTPSVFNTPKPDAAKSLFAQATQNVFGNVQPLQNVYSNEKQTNATNIFAAASQNINQKMFDNQTNIAGPSIFTINQTSTVNVFEQNRGENSVLYSRLEDLTKEDLEEFQSDRFRLGFVPELPPPQCLC